MDDVSRFWPVAFRVGAVHAVSVASRLKIPKRHHDVMQPITTPWDVQRNPSGGMPHKQVAGPARRSFRNTSPSVTESSAVNVS